MVCLFSIKVSGIPSAAEQQIIVDKHNALRRLVASGNELRGHPGPQKPATNMRQVKWDADLANAALYKTKLCQRTSIPTGSAGQMIFFYYKLFKNKYMN